MRSLPVSSGGKHSCSIGQTGRGKKTCIPLMHTASTEGNHSHRPRLLNLEPKLRQTVPIMGNEYSEIISS